MLRYFAKSALLLGISVVISAASIRGVLWVIGQTLFPFQANGSIVHSDRRQGDRLAADRSAVHQGRVLPAAAVGGVFDATASASSSLCASNYALRDRVARALGPIVTYADGDKKGQLVAPDVEAWFKDDKSGGNPHIVAQWADAHNSIAQAWVTGDPTHAAYVDAWAKAHDDAVKDWIKKNPATPQPKAPDLAVVFFESFSNDHPGTFPSSVTKTGADGKPATDIEPVSDGLRHPVDLLRHVASGPSRRRAQRRAGRSRDRLRLRPRPGYHAGERRIPARSCRGQMGGRQEATPARCAKRSRRSCRRRRMPRGEA